MKELKDLYDIYDFWYMPWWRTWWGMTIVAIIALCLLVLFVVIVIYSIKYYRRKTYNEWQHIHKQLGVLLQKRSLTKFEYQQLIALLKRKLVLCFDTALESKTDEELQVWLGSFPTESIEHQLASLFNSSTIRFAPALGQGYELTHYIQMALDYDQRKKVNA